MNDVINIIPKEFYIYLGVMLALTFGTVFCSIIMFKLIRGDSE